MSNLANLTDQELAINARTYLEVIKDYMRELAKRRYSATLSSASVSPGCDGTGSLKLQISRNETL